MSKKSSSKENFLILSKENKIVNLVTREAYHFSDQIFEVLYFITKIEDTRLIDNNTNNYIKFLIKLCKAKDSLKDNLIKKFVDYSYRYYLNHIWIWDKNSISDLINRFKQIHSQILEEAFKKEKEEIKEKKETKENGISVFYSKCPFCGSKTFEGEIEESEFLGKECPICNRIFTFNGIENINVEKKILKEKEIKLISFEEAIEINYLHPGTVLYSYDKRSWFLADSNPVLWSDFTKEHPLYFTTLSFK